MGCGCRGSGVPEINNENCSQESACVPSVGFPSTLNIGPCSCGCSPCTCGNTPTPASFINQAPACQESHVKKVFQQIYQTTVDTASAFNMPACSESISITLPGVVSLQVGAYLWNAVYGYLKIIAFDSISGRATLQNDCTYTSAAPGTEIPACTQFNIVDPPYAATSECGEGVFLISNFTAPALNASVTINVTGIAGLLINSYIQVGVGKYLLTAIVTPSSITIKNDGGSGIVPGVTIYAKDADGNCVTPITPYVGTPCSEIPDSPGAIVVCVDGRMTTLSASLAGQVPVCVDPATNTFEAQDTYIEIPVCMALTACLTLVSGTDDYTIVVDDNSDFHVGDVVVISYVGLEDWLWVVTNVNVDTVHVTIHSIVPNVTDVACISDGTSVCHASCCDQIDYDLHQFTDGTQAADIEYAWNADDTGSVDPGEPAFTSTTRSITLVNPTTNVMYGLITVDYIITGHFSASMGAWIRTLLQPKIGSAVLPAVPVQATIRDLYDERVFGPGGSGTPCNAFSSQYSAQYHHTECVAVPASSSVQYDASLDFTNVKFTKSSEACCPCADIGPEGDGAFTITAANAHIHVMGVAVQSV